MVGMVAMDKPKEIFQDLPKVCFSPFDYREYIF